MESNDCANADRTPYISDKSITEEILIEQAKLSRSEFNRDVSSSSSSDSYKQQLPLNEEVLIQNAVLVKSVSLKTASTVSVDTDKTEASGEDEVFELSMEKREEDNKIPRRNKTLSDVENNNIQDIDDTNVETLPSGILHELKDKLESHPIDIPRLNIVDMEDGPNGCRTPANSVDEIPENPTSPTVQPKHLETQNEPVAQMTEKLGTLKDNFHQQVGQNKLIETSKVYEDKGGTVKFEDEPTDVDFDELVIDIANAISGPEFEAIKSVLKGLDCMTEQDLIHVTNPLTYLNLLRKYSLISRDNLSYLQTIVSILNKPEVQQKASLYMHHKYDVVFFYPPKEHIPSSYDTMTCHVRGRDFTRLKRCDLEAVRVGLANMLFIPSHCVYIVGIEPGFSVIVTLMFHRRYVNLLEAILQASIARFAQLGIDALQLRGRTFSVDKNEDCPESGPDYDSSVFLSVFHQLKDKNTQLEEKDEEIVRLNQELEFMQLELDTVNTELEILTERAVQRSITLRKQPEVKRSFRRHGRSFSAPAQETMTNEIDNPEYYWDVWQKPSTTSGYDVDWSLKELEADIKSLENRNSVPVDLNVSTDTSTDKDKETLMQEIETLLKELGAKEI